MSHDLDRRGGAPLRQRPPVRSLATERVSNAERDAVVEQLRLNCADGRLDMDEFGERLERALVARTGADLTAVLRHLPLLPVPEATDARRKTARRALVVPYVAVNLVLLLLCAAAWSPVWPVLGWVLSTAVVLLVIGRTSRSAATSEHRRRTA